MNFMTGKFYVYQSTQKTVLSLKILDYPKVHFKIIKNKFRC